MELARFHMVRTAVQSNARPGGAADLTAAQDRVWRGLTATGWFDEVEVGATDEVDNLVVAMCTFPEQLLEDRVAQRLVLLWEDRLRYPFWAAHATLVHRGQVELEGASRTSTQGHYLTVHIVAQRGAPRDPTQLPAPFVPGQRRRS